MVFSFIRNAMHLLLLFDCKSFTDLTTKIYRDSEIFNRKNVILCKKYSSLSLFPSFALVIRLWFSCIKNSWLLLAQWGSLSSHGYEFTGYVILLSPCSVWHEKKNRSSTAVNRINTDLIPKCILCELVFLENDQATKRNAIKLIQRSFRLPAVALYFKRILSSFSFVFLSFITSLRCGLFVIGLTSLVHQFFTPTQSNFIQSAPTIQNGLKFTA